MAGQRVWGDIARRGAVLRPWLDEDAAIAIRLCPVCLRHEGVDHLEALTVQLGACVERIAQRWPARILLCGGDCASEIAPVAHLNQYYQGCLSVVWLDAHADLNKLRSSSSGHLHGMPFRLLLGEGHPALLRAVPLPLRPEQVHLAGVRDVDPAERDYIETHRLVWHEVASLNPAWPSYLHIDLDVLDPAENPAVQCPTPGGLSRRALNAAILAVSQRTRLAGAGLTECTAEDMEQGEAAIHILQSLKTILA